MRNDTQTMLKQTKQQINALCLRHGKIFEGKSRWTPKHMQWLRSTRLGNAIIQEAPSEYLVTLDQLVDKIERPDKRIEEFAQQKHKVCNCPNQTKTGRATSF